MTPLHIPLLVPITFLFASLLIPLLGLINRTIVYAAAIFAASLALLFSLAGLLTVLAQGEIRYFLGGWKPPIGIEFVMDPLSGFMEVVITGVALLALIHAKKSVAHETPDKFIPFYNLTMLFMTGITGMVITGDLFNLYVFLEIGALTGYALVAIGDKRAPVSAFRYLTLGTAGATFYLLGLAFIYMSVGSLNMADISRLLPLVRESRPVLVGLVLMVLGIGLKMALFPMHGWLADAYTYASSSATALIAPIGTKVAAYVLLRIMFFVVDPTFIRDVAPLAHIIGYLGALGVIWGSIMAVCQSELKRMLAYSSVAQVGYIALGIGLASPLGFIGAVLHIVNHAFMKGCLFFVSGNLRLKLGHSTIPLFTDSLSRTMPWSAASFSLAAVSMIGLPPTAGFFSKWYLALGAVEQSNWLFVGVLVVSSLMNAVYFFRVLERMYVRPQTPASGEPSAGAVRNEAPGAMLAPTLILAGGILLLGILNAWIVTHLIHFMIPGGL